MSQTAKLISPKPKSVYFPLFDQVTLLDVAGPSEVLTQANRVAGQKIYDIRYVSNAPDGRVTSSTGLELATNPLPKRMPSMHTLFVPGGQKEAIVGALFDEEYMEWVDRAASVAHRKASSCTGAFIFAQAGILDGRRVTTHWYGIEKLQKYYSDAIVEPDTLYVHDNDLWTSAGVLASVDMTLAMVKYDLGAQIALQIARELVMFLVRDGGQSQFSAPVNLQSKVGNSNLTGLFAWLEKQLENSVTVEQMAEHMNMSPRSLHRHCQETLSMTPAQILNELRLERSRNLLHEPSIALKSIAGLCGFNNGSSLSKSFSRRFGVSPTRYREHFLNGQSLDQYLDREPGYSL